MTRVALPLTVLLAVCSLASRAHATGFTDIGQDIRLHDDDEFSLELDGYLRVRGEILHNLDLDHGAAPSGEVLFPVPIDDPQAQTLYEMDMRLRTDLAIYAPGGTVAVKLRLDTLDNLALGSTPDGAPSASTTQRALETAIRVRRAYGEVLTPIGVLAAGRMGNHWGLGMLANGGDCADCDSGDAQDRIAFITPIAGHVWAASFDLTSSGPQIPRHSGFRPVDITPVDYAAHAMVELALGEGRAGTFHIANERAVTLAEIVAALRRHSAPQVSRPVDELVDLATSRDDVASAVVAASLRKCVSGGRLGRSTDLFLATGYDFDARATAAVLAARGLVCPSPAPILEAHVEKSALRHHSP